KGDTVKVNDIVVEVETAKSLVELPVPFAGTVTELLVNEGETVEVGTPIIRVETGAGAKGRRSRPSRRSSGWSRAPGRRPPSRTRPPRVRSSRASRGRRRRKST